MKDENWANDVVPDVTCFSTTSSESSQLWLTTRLWVVHLLCIVSLSSDFLSLGKSRN